MKRLSLIFLALLAPFPSLFACDLPSGKAAATPQTTPACSYSEAAVALNEQSSFGVFAWSDVGFGIINGAITAAPISATGGFVSVPASFDDTIVATPQVATDGTDFLVAEYSSGAIAYRMLHADGSRGPRVVIATNSGSVAGVSGSATVIWDGSEYYIFYTEFVRTSEFGSLTPRVSAAIVERNGALAQKSTVIDNAALLTAVKASGTQAFVLWKKDNVVEGGYFGRNVSIALLVHPNVTDVSKAAAANNGSTAAVAFVTTSGVQVMTAAGGNFASLSAPKTLESALVTEIEVVPDGSDFLIIRSDADLNARATRLSGGNFGPTFALATGDVVSAASNSRGTVVMSAWGCGTIQSQFIARGATTAGAPENLTLKATPQSLPQIVSNSAGHQLTYFEGTALYTQSLDTAISPGVRAKLADGASSFVSISTSDGGSAVAWVEGAGGTILRVARFDAAGGPRGGTVTIPATANINSVSLAESNDQLLIAYQGVVSHRPEVHAVVVTNTGAITQDALLSNSTDEGIDVTAGVDGANWMIAWRSGRGGQAAVVEAPRTDLRSQTRRDVTLPATGVPRIGAVGSGNIYWTEQASNGDYAVHRTNLNGSDTVLAVSSTDILSAVRLIGGTPYWSRRSQTSVTVATINSSLACFDNSTIGGDVDFDVRNGAVGTFVYFDGVQLRVQAAGTFTEPPPASSASRHRAVRH